MIKNYLDKSKSVLLVGPFARLVPASSKKIFVDGGARLHKSGLVVGDGDSYSGPLDVELPKRKDYSDFAFTLRHLPKHISEVKTVGFLGGRRDHEWINLGEAHRFLKSRKNTTFTFDHSITGFSQGRFDFRRKGLFSLLVFQNTQLELSGKCEFKFRGRLKALSSHGLSNVGSGKINLITTGPAFLFFESENSPLNGFG